MSYIPKNETKDELLKKIADIWKVTQKVPEIAKNDEKSKEIAEIPEEKPIKKKVLN